jgi:hypothetical protein
MNTADKSIFNSLQTIVYKDVMQQIQNLSILTNVPDEFSKARILLIAMKGLAIRSLYPYPETRTMSDFDLAIKEADFEKGIQILLKIGFKIEGNDHSIHIQMVYGNTLLLELHRQPFDEEQMNLPQNYANELWKNSVPISICGKALLTFSDNGNILYLCLHLAKHYENGGFGLRQLCDIVLFIEVKHDKIDWERFYSQTIQLGVSRFVIMVFVSCAYLFDMRIPECLSKNIISSNKYLEMFIQDIFDGGTFGVSTPLRNVSNRMMNKLGL